VGLGVQLIHVVIIVKFSLKRELYPKQLCVKLIFVIMKV